MWSTMRERTREELVLFSRVLNDRARGRDSSVRTSLERKFHLQDRKRFPILLHLLVGTHQLFFEDDEVLVVVNRPFRIHVRYFERMTVNKSVARRRARRIDSCCRCRRRRWSSRG